MKKIAFFLLISLGLLSCSNNDDKIQNPYLVAPLVNLSLNLNLPEYTDLKFPGGSFIVNNQGIKGVIVYCITDNYYIASELSDPNHYPNACSKMEVTGIIATCPCDDGNTNDIVTGQFTPPNNEKYPMLQYRAERNGDIVTVYN